MAASTQRFSVTAWCAALLLLIGGIAPPLPYGFYTFLRIVTCIWGIHTVIRTQETKGFPFLLSIGLTILYNPIIRIHLPREVWEPINIITAVLIVAVEIYLSSVKNKLPSI